MLENISFGLKWLTDTVANARTVFGLAVFFGVFWLLGGDAIEGLGLPRAVHSLLGVATFAFFAAGIAQVTPRVWGVAQSAWAERRRRAKVIDYLDTLSPKEVKVIVECVRDNRQSVELPLHMGAGPSLAHKGILIPARIGHPLGYSYTIDGFVWDYLQKNRESVLERSEKK